MKIPTCVKISFDLITSIVCALLVMMIAVVLIVSLVPWSILSFMAFMFDFLEREYEKYMELLMRAGDWFKERI